MNYKVFSLFTIALIIGSFISVHGEGAPRESECSFEPHLRENCGGSGITQQECNEKGCCFSDQVYNVPWCFHPISPPIPDDDECEFE
ncbi:putative gastrointestinal growth factor xP1 [Anomaloglossus baeobatrachus]|uniref:putative gastrointestinal growth factor xP1 n=1 Tax=Anomaloglossus baeobatrachus TaxID=238106 RepID=UPI003F4FC225